MPTVNITGPYRFFFYSSDCDEPRHIHVRRDRAEAKFWLDGTTLAFNEGFSARDLRQIRRLVIEHEGQLVTAWEEHCGS